MPEYKGPQSSFEKKVKQRDQLAGYATSRPAT